MARRIFFCIFILKITQYFQFHSNESKSSYQYIINKNKQKESIYDIKYYINKIDSLLSLRKYLLLEFI